MTLRLIEINLPKNKQDAVEELISDRKEILDLTVHPSGRLLEDSGTRQMEDPHRGVLIEGSQF